ncbi:Polyphosphate kinase [Kordia antarctica]|uniref:Polyphosphate kinase n=1 Tax=Kordia antarctica TaxID=1218801 RepID=A0A7L4ZMV1_9FLAO|nr:polyphosphate kinase 1 [Kordia antarctica]QHI37841.1 Polyphosphate kinase [Kordia antarctica]
MSLISSEYYNRDVSWLRFNHRVLQEAADARNPLYERIKFLAIFSSNLDEFFKVRVSAIRQIKQLDKGLRKKLITKPNRLLRKIKKEVNLQQQEFGNIFKNQIIPALEKEGISLIDSTRFSEAQAQFAKAYYKEELESKLTLNYKISSEEDIFIENEQLYLASIYEGQLVVFKIPSNTPRFIVFPTENDTCSITFIDDILKHNFKEVYPENTFYSIKVSRDAELYIENEYSGNLLQKIKDSLGNRKTGQVTRILVDQKAPKNLLDELKDELNVNDTDIVLGGSYHNFKDFFGFPNPTDKNLSIPDVLPVRNKQLDAYDSIFEAITEKDRMLYFPYESFDHVAELVEEAAKDVLVSKIKITLYRVAKESRLTKALIDATKNGKEVTVFMEAKARFDEQNNIKWGTILEENGAKVIYSYPGIKVHSKILSIERIENEKPVLYGYIGTGNFNEKTATLYTDFCLMTKNEKITSELIQVFQVLEREIIIPKSKKLLISPFTTRSTFLELIDNEIKNAKAGKEAYIILKLNSIQDTKMIDALYEASNAGVKIDMIVRGICCIVPGIPNQSENITVKSILGQYLEHARVYIFANGGKEKLYIGSADWMTRNLDHRIEVITPILDADIHKKLRKFVQWQWNDSVKARIMDAKQKNKYIETDEKAIHAQQKAYEELVKMNS